LIRVAKTSVETFARCPRLYKYKYLDNRTTKFNSDNLTFGQEFHEGLDGFWNGKSGYKIKPDLFVDPDQFQIAQALMDSYFDRYDLDEVNVIQVETKHEIDTEFGQRVVIFDAIIEYRGRTLLVESKTTRSYLSDSSWYWAKLDLDLQTGYYAWFAKEILDIPIDGVLYDVSRVPKMKMGKDGRRIIQETPSDFYHRVRGKIFNDQDSYHVRRLIQPNVDEVMEQVGMWEEAMSEATRLGRFPKNHTSCQMYGRTCEFKPVCTGESDLDNERLYKIRKRKNETT